MNNVLATAVIWTIGSVLSIAIAVHAINASALQLRRQVHYRGEEIRLEGGAQIARGGNGPSLALHSTFRSGAFSPEADGQALKATLRQPAP